MPGKERILLVDDDEVTLRLAAHIFTKAGYDVHTAGDGFEGSQATWTVKRSGEPWKKGDKFGYDSPLIYNISYIILRPV